MFLAAFANRPHHILGVVTRTSAGCALYPASFAGWLFLAIYHVGPAVRSLEPSEFSLLEPLSR